MPALVTVRSGTGALAQDLPEPLSYFYMRIEPRFPYLRELENTSALDAITLCRMGAARRGVQYH